MGMLVCQGLWTGCRHGQLGGRTKVTHHLESEYIRWPQAASQTPGPCRARLALWTQLLWWATRSPPGTLSPRMYLLALPCPCLGLDVLEYGWAALMLVLCHRGSSRLHLAALQRCTLPQAATAGSIFDRPCSNL